MGIHKRLSLKPQRLADHITISFVVTNCYKGGLDPQLQANMIEVYLEPVNVFYFGASTFQKRPFPIKTVVIWVPGIMYM